MIGDFLSFSQLLVSKNIQLINSKLNKSIMDYLFLHFSDSFSIHQNQPILQNIRESDALVINKCTDHIDKQNNAYFIIAFKKTIIIINQSSISMINNLFSINSNIKIIFLPNTKDIFHRYIQIQNTQIECDTEFLSEIKNFCNKLSIKQKTENKLIRIWKFIQPCIAGFLINEGYFKSNKIFFDFSAKSNRISSIENFNESDYIGLRSIGSGSSFRTDLIYYIEKESLCVIKRPILNNEETLKLLKREVENYSNINYPFMPKLLGINHRINNPIIEFINGNTLLNIENLHLEFGDKITIIFKLILIMNYLHKNEFVYRDLKPNNVMIDPKKNIFLVDFDRMIKISESVDEDEHTADFSSVFADPEVNQQHISYKNDIFSLGQMIYFILNETFPNRNLDVNINSLSKNPDISQIYKRCTDSDVDQRPCIFELMFEFYLSFKQIVDISIIKEDPEFQIIKNLYDFEIQKDNVDKAIHFYSLAAKQNYSKAQYFLGVIYNTNTFVPRDFEKAFSYFSLAAKQNHPGAQYALGNIYFLGKDVKRDIKKAINYCLLAADKNDKDAQYALGNLYSFGKYEKPDINKAINYYTLAANQKHLKAQYALGTIYYKKNDIDKAIHYLTLASDQNHSESQFILGSIYHLLKGTPNDINKAIHYYTLSANQNNCNAQCSLGVLYYMGVNITLDIHKSIYYFEMAAKQNHPEAQFCLGDIYSSGEYIPRNINKAMNYYLLSANQNCSKAQIALGNIYYSGEFIPRDMNKAIHYYTLAANQNDIDAQVILADIYKNNGKNESQDINDAIHYFTLAADQNDSDAQFNLANMYYSGEKIKQDINKAIHYYTLAANQNHPFALFILGSIYYTGQYVTKDINKAIHYLSIASDYNNEFAQMLLANIYISGTNVARDIKKAIYYFKLAADQNIPDAQYSLGIFYYSGFYVEKDINKAISYLSSASNQDHPNAQFYLGYIYITKDINKAINYLTLAANQGVIKAQYNLGVIYHKGYYVTRDIYRAIHYYTLAANHDDSEAQYALGAIYSSDKLVSHDISKALHYLTLASNQNNASAQLEIGIIYLLGKYVTPNINKAIHYISLAAEHKNSDALGILGCFFILGFYVNQDINKGISYLTLAANQDHYEAQFILGIFYLKGQNVKQDMKKGIYFLTRSSTNRFLKAHFALGSLLHQGKYIKSDINKAIKYYKEASSFNDQYAKNNLGIIYKNGFGDEIKKNVGLSIAYFEEAIRQKNDILSLYNLSHVYIFIDKTKDGINKSIELLIKSSLLGFLYSKYLLCIALIKKHNFNIEKIKEELDKQYDEANELKRSIIDIINTEKLYDALNFKNYYKYFKLIDFLYDFEHRIIISKEFQQESPTMQNSSGLPNLSQKFYEGFGINI